MEMPLAYGLGGHEWIIAYRPTIVNCLAGLYLGR